MLLLKHRLDLNFISDVLEKGIEMFLVQFDVPLSLFADFCFLVLDGITFSFEVPIQQRCDLMILRSSFV
jgi:hypothetical protein